MSDTRNAACGLVDPTCRLCFGRGRPYAFTRRVCLPQGSPPSPPCASSAGGSGGWKGKKAVMVPPGGGKPCLPH